MRGVKWGSRNTIVIFLDGFHKQKESCLKAGQPGDGVGGAGEAGGVG